MKWARSQKMPTPPLKALLNALAARADDKGKTWVSQATLAEDMGCTDRSIRRLLSTLYRLGVISRVVRSKGRFGRITDEISLPLHKSFDLPKSAIPTGQGFPVKDKVSNRTKTAVPTGQGVPGNIKGITSPFHGEDISKGREGTYTHATCDADVRGGGLSPDRENLTEANVVHFRPRGAL